MAINVNYNPVGLLLNGASQAGMYQGLGDRKSDSANSIQMALRQAQMNMENQRAMDAQQNALAAQQQAGQVNDEHQAMGGYYRKQDDVNITDANTARNDLAKAEVKKNTAQAMLDEYKAKQTQQEIASGVQTIHGRPLTQTAAAKPTKVDNSASEFEFKKLSTAETAYMKEAQATQKQMHDLSSADPANPQINVLQKKLDDLDTKLTDVRTRRDALQPATATPPPGNPTLANPSGQGFTQGTNAQGQPVLTMNGHPPADATGQVSAPATPLTSEQINATPLKQRQASVVSKLQSDPALTESVRNLATDEYKKENFAGLGIDFKQYLAQITEHMGSRGPLDKQTAAAILQGVNGDATKARALAIFNGYVI